MGFIIAFIYFTCGLKGRAAQRAIVIVFVSE